MIVGIHQPHYFPWMGYYDKMAKSDTFILMDDVQLEKGSLMYRNRILAATGKVEYLTISGDKHGYLDKKYWQLQSTNNDVWLTKHKNALRAAYGQSPWFDEVWSRIEDLFVNDESTICAYAVRSVLRVKELLEIPTRIVYQHDLTTDAEARKNNLVIALCQAVGGNRYLSGNGARKYTDEDSFAAAGLQIRYQQFTQPAYPQAHAAEFVPGISMLDMLFNCGIEETKRIFWETCRSVQEFADKE